MTSDGICTSLVRFYTGEARFEVWMRCEAGELHTGKHRNKHGRNWTTETEDGRLELA